MRLRLGSRWASRMHDQLGARPLFVLWNSTERRLAETVVSVGHSRRARSLVPPEITPLPGFCPSHPMRSACASLTWPAPCPVRPAVPKAKASRCRARGPAGRPLGRPLIRYRNSAREQHSTQPRPDGAPIGAGRCSLLVHALPYRLGRIVVPGIRPPTARRIFVGRTFAAASARPTSV